MTLAVAVGASLLALSPAVPAQQAEATTPELEASFPVPDERPESASALVGPPDAAVAAANDGEQAPVTSVEAGMAAEVSLSSPASAPAPRRAPRGGPAPPVTEDEGWTETSHWETNADGSRTVEVATEAVFFEDEAGDWQDIDLSVVETPEGFTAGAVDNVVVVADTVGDETVRLESEAGALVVGHPQADPTVEGVAVDSLPADVPAPDPAVPEAAPLDPAPQAAAAEDQVVFADALPAGDDLVVSFTAAGFKEEVIAADRAGGGSWLTEAQLPVGVVARQVASGIEFVDTDADPDADGDDVVLGSVSHGWAFDATEGFPGPVRVALVSQVGTTVVVESTVDGAWFADEARVFPVRLDPTWYWSNWVEGPGGSNSTYFSLDTFVDSYYCSTSYWNSPEMWVGGLPVAEQCGIPTQAAIARTLVRFATDNYGAYVGDQIVTAASVKVRNFGGATPSYVRTFDLFESGGLMTQATNWYSQPFPAGAAVSSGAWGSGYATWTFSGSGMVAMAQRWFDSHTANKGVIIKARSERDYYSYRRLYPGGAGQGLEPSVSITYIEAPSVPRTVSASAGYAAANVYWSAPSSNGGTPITSYQVRPYNVSTGQYLAALSACGGCTSATVSGLTPGQQYRFDITAANSVGTSPVATTNTVTILEPLALTKTVGTVGPGGSVDCATTGAGEYVDGAAVGYCVTVRNLSGATRTVPSVIDALAPGLAVLAGSATVDGAPCTTVSSPTCTVSGQTLSVGSMTVGGSATRTLIYRAAVAAPGACAPLANSATATDASGRTYTASTTVQGCGGGGAGLGLEEWFSYTERGLGPAGVARVNVANGNLVVSHTDTPPVPGHGRLAYVLGRTYNAQAPTALPLGASLGGGWTFNVSAGGDLAASLTADGLVIPASATMASPGGVTLIDRDGTRHVFTPEGTTLSALGLTLDGLPTSGSAEDLLGFVTGLLGAETGVGGLDLSSLASQLTDWALSLSVRPEALNVCLDTTYSPPPGVQLSMWRFLAVQTNPDGCAGAPPGAAVIGYGTQRADRTRQYFDALGRLTALVDPAGNALAYTYQALNPFQLAAVYEPAACPAGPGDPTCRALRFSWAPDSVSVTDPGGRTVVYDRTGNRLRSVTTSVGGTVVERWGYAYQGDPGVDCGAPTGTLCAVSPPRAGAGEDIEPTTLAYDQAEPARVASIVERHGSDEADPPTTTFTYTPGTTDAVRGDRAVRYSAIDAAGRVGERLEGALAEGGAFAAWRRAVMGWDTPGCRPGDGQADHHLCTLTRETLEPPAGAPPGWAPSPDQTTTWTYGPEGQMLSETRAMGDDPDLTTTWGYRSTYTFPGGTRTGADATITGPGPAGVSAAPRPPDVLYATTDRVAELSPRGNAAGTAWAQHLSEWDLDAAPGVDGAPEPADPGTVGSPCGAGNSGLVCAETRPEAITTAYSYDGFGQRATMTTPRGGVYAYAYYGDAETDLTGTVSAGGWLRAVTDPAGAFVAFGHDRAGNVVRTWDRNATAANALPPSSYPGPLGSPPARHSETRYGPGTAAAALAAPWRYPTVTADQLGHATRLSLDAHGNALSTTSPRGVAAGSADFDTTQGFDARDHLVTRTWPEGGQWRFRFDEAANPTGSVDPNGRVTVTTFDAVNRAVATEWTRGPWPQAGADAAPCEDTPTGVTSDPLFGAEGQADRIRCRSTVAYDGVDQLIATADADGAERWSAYDGAGRATATFTERDATTWLRAETVYDPDANPVRQCRPRLFTEGDGTCDDDALFATHIVYDGAGRPTATTAYRLDGADLVTLGTQTGYDADSNPVSGRDANGNETTAAFDLLGRRTSATVPRAPGVENITTWAYDPSGNVTAITQPAGQITALSYDAAQRPLDTVEGATSAEAATATDAGAATLADGAGNTRTRVLYDPDGHVVGRYGPRAFPVGDGAALTTPDPRFLVRADYDTDGRASASYTPRYDPALAPDPGLSPTQAQDCPTGITAAPVPGTTVPAWPAGTGVCVARVGYDPAGNVVTRSESERDRDVTLAFTDDNLLATVTTPDPADPAATVDAQSYAYDGAGRPVAVTDALGHTDTTEYTTDGLVSSVAQAPSGARTHVTTTAYDADGNRSAVTDAEGHTFTTAYSADGLVTERATPPVVVAGPAEPLVTAYRYDPNGNPVEVFTPAASAGAAPNPAGTPTVNTFSADNLIESTLAPLAGDGSSSRLSTYGYDPAGRKVTQSTGQVDGAGAPVGPTTTQGWSWHPNDRPATRTGREGETVTTAYDPAGNVATLTDSTNPAAALGGDYYLDGAPRTVTAGTGASPATTTYAYDGAGRLAARADALAGDQSSATFAYNRAGLASTMSSSAAPGGNWAWTYDSEGRARAEGRPNGETLTRGYDDDDLLAAQALTGPGGAALASWSYDYDNLGRVTGQTHSGQPAAGGEAAPTGTFTYGYDPAGRLSSHSENSLPMAVAYDHDGNRTAYGTSTFTYRADGSVATGPSGTYAYTGWGGLSDDGCAATTYDGWDRTATVTPDPIPAPACDSGAPGASYAYDGLDRRAATTAAGVVTELAYDGWGAATTASTEGSLVPTRYALGPDGTARALTGADGLEYLTGDGNGNTTTTTNEAGEVACAARFDPYGTPTGAPAAGSLCASGDSANELGYQGARPDPATGSYQFGSRTYDPASATWNQPDSAASLGAGADLSVGVDPLTMNRYAYVNGDPINFADPSGHISPDAAERYAESARGRGDAVSCSSTSYGLDCWTAPTPGEAAAKAQNAATAETNKRSQGWLADQAVLAYMGQTSPELAQYMDWNDRCDAHNPYYCVAAFSLTLDAGLDAATDLVNGGACQLYGACASGAAIRDHFAEFLLIDLPVGFITGAVAKSLSARFVTADPSALRAIPGARAVDDALSGLTAGRSSGVRTVGSADELDDLFTGLSRGGTQIESTYPGQLVRLPDGTTVGLRGASRSGGPTIDVRLPDGSTLKVHVNP